MTEEEAKTKWCPMIQVTSSQSFNDVEYGDNRGTGDSSHHCIASDCMWWVEDQPEITPYESEGHCGAVK